MNETLIGNLVVHCPVTVDPVEDSVWGRGASHDSAPLLNFVGWPPKFWHIGSSVVKCCWEIPPIMLLTLLLSVHIDVTNTRPLIDRNRATT